MDRLNVSESATHCETAAESTEPPSAWDQEVSSAWLQESQAGGHETGSDGPGATHETASHIVQNGETLDELSARYGVPVSDILGANPTIKNQNLIRNGQQLNIPLDKVHDALPGSYLEQERDTLSRIAERYRTSVRSLATANNITNPDRIRAGEHIWVPAAGGRLEQGGSAQPTDLTPVPPVPTSQERSVNGAVLGAQSAARACDLVRASAAKGNGAARAALQDGSLQQSLATARDRLGQAVGDEITSKVGAEAPDAAVAAAGRDITARYANDPGAQKLVAGAVAQVRTDRQVRAIVTNAHSESDPVKALAALNAGYAKAPSGVQQAVLSDANAGSIIDAAVRWSNQPLTQTPAAGASQQAQTAQAIGRLDHATQGLDKGLAGAVADRAASAYQGLRNGGVPIFGARGVTTLMALSSRIAGTAQGDETIARFAAIGAWNGDAVRNAVSAGADPAYAIALGRQLKAAGQDPSTVVQTIDDGMAQRDSAKIAGGASPDTTLEVAGRMQAAGLDASGVIKVASEGVQHFKDKVDGDVKQLAQHDSELAWLVRNDGAGMTPQLLNQAVAAYRAGKGTGWQQQESALRQRLVDDGGKLTQQMVALNQSSPHLAGASARLAQTLSTIANDPSAGLAISSAIQSDPRLA